VTDFSHPAPVNQITEAKKVLTVPKLWAMFHLPGRPAPVCSCPFTTDRRSGFSVSDDGLRWIDFASAERGDAIDFLAKIRGFSRPEAYVEFRCLYEAILSRKEASDG
jgi:hypothetical protein